MQHQQLGPVACDYPHMITDPPQVQEQPSLTSSQGVNTTSCLSIQNVSETMLMPEGQLKKQNQIDVVPMKLTR